VEKIKQHLKKFFQWICTPAGMLGLLALGGIALGGCRLGFSQKRRKLLYSGARGIERSAGTGALGSKYSAGSVAGTLAVAFDQLNDIQRGQLEQLDRTAGNIVGEAEQLDSCNRGLEEGLNSITQLARDL
jgi:hypothetical protein